MVQGYYTLDESAQLLGMSADDLKQLARKGEIRSFQDRGTWRFRIQDIQEMARRRTDGSDLELPGGQSPPPQATDSPVPRTPKPQKKSEDIFDFSLASEEGVDADITVSEDINLDKPPPSSKSASSSKRSGPAGSDSDVRLVTEGSDISNKPPADSDVKMFDSGGPKSGPRSSKTGMAGPKSPRPAKVKSDEAPAEQLDSGVRLVPMDSDSDVRIVGSDTDDTHVPLGVQPPKGATDSDIRLESLLPSGLASGKEGPLTEEINLDEELKKEEARQRGQKAKHKLQPPDLPQKSPFELSDPELGVASGEVEPSSEDRDSSSDFDLTPASESSSPLELTSSDEFKLDVPDDVLPLADESPTNLKGPMSGINLGHPADSGISLEQSGQAQESDFELTLEDEPDAAQSKPATPKPSPDKLVQADESDSSEFELSLDADTAGIPESDSEFELTLEDSGGLAPMEGEATEADQEKDIFETDFEVPALGEESASEAVEVGDIDTDLENSDFELAIGEEDAIGEDLSGSEVVALDEEVVDEAAAETVQVPRRGKKRAKQRAVAGVDDADELEVVDEADEDVIEEEADEAGPQVVLVPQAPWGIFPVAVLFPCVIVMALLSLMSFELVQTQQGSKPGMLTRAIGGLVGAKK